MNTLGDVSPGDVLGRYELLIPIARGGMATVWAARLKGSRGFQKIVAIKTILPDLIEDPRFDQMFLDEASLASRIHHPHVVEILDLGEQDGVLYLVMEWVDGEPLSLVLKTAWKTTGIPLPIAVRIASQACAGLHAAHELHDEAGNLLGLVHRDVSPQNILVTFEGVVKVVDFGVAKATSRAGVTTAGQIKGKVAYMAPEQARGGPLDRRSDLFALGIVLYLMTTGQHPFRGDNDTLTVHKICSEPLVPPSALVPGYPQALEAVVCKALAKDPNDRYLTANELLRALGHALPESARVLTDDAVAAFMRQLLQHRHHQRKQALRAAQHLADERAAGWSVESLVPADMGSHSGFTPSTTPNRSLAGLPPTPPRPRGVFPTEGTDDRNAGLTTRDIAPRASETVVSDPVLAPKAPWYRRRLVIFPLGLGVLATIVWLTLANGHGPTNPAPADSTPIHSASTQPAEAKVDGNSTSVDTPDDTLGDSRAPSTIASRQGPLELPPRRADGAPPASPSASTSLAITATRPRHTQTFPQKPPATAKDAGTFMSPVRNPGF